MFFDGKFKSRQTVSLRGDSKSEQKEDLLLKAQQGRDQRELFRKRTKAATAIQAFFRGTTVLADQRNVQRSLFDQEMRTPGATREKLLLLLRRLNFFFQPSPDEERYRLLTQLLLTDLATSAKAFFPLPEESTAQWKTPLKMFVRVSFRVASHPTIGNPARYLAASFLDVTVVRPNPSLLYQGAQPSAWNALTSPWLTPALSQIKAYWIQTENADPNITALFTQVLTKMIEEHSALLKAQGQKGVDSRFILEILCIPHLNHKLGAGWGNFVGKFPLELVLVLANSSLSSWVASLPPTPPNAFAPPVHCAANILTLSVAKLPKLTSQFLSTYCQFLGRLIAYLPDNIFVSTRVPIIHDEEIDDDDDMEVDAAPPKTAVDPRLYQALKLLYSSDHINQLLKLLPQKPSAELTPDEEKRLASLFSVLHAVVFRFKEVQFDTLNTMAFGSGVKTFVRHLWRTVQNHMVYRSYVESSKDYLSNPGTQPEFWTNFSLFVIVFSHVLTTLSDHEFFQEDSLIFLPDTVQLISVIKSMLSKAFRSEFQVADSNTVVGPVNFATLKGLFIRLMKHLHDRDTRRRFCPENHWITKIDLSLENVSAQFLDMFDLREATDDEALRDQFQALNEGDEEALLEYMTMPKPPSVTMTSQAQRAAENAIALLKNVPFVVPFADRVSVFRQLINRDRQYSFKTSHQVVVRRSKVFEDGFEKLSPLGKNLKGRLQITFVDDHGIEEAGIDGGGVFKEFMNELIKSGFNPSYGLFKATEAQTIYPSPKALTQNANARKQFEFLGRMVGKSLYTGILVELPFAGFFLNKLLGRNNYLDDLNTLDPDLYRNLLFVKHYPGNVEDLSLYFCVTEADSNQTTDLVPGGKNIPVTNQNRMEYIYRMAYFKLNTQINQACSAFLSGMSDMIDLSWLKLFDQEELKTLISGARAPVNISDLRRHTNYVPPYSDSHQTIQWFWAAVESFNEEEKGLLLQFVTSCSRPPLLGFSELNPRFSINPVTDVDRLPTASTCINLLKLPIYGSYEQLRQKLLYSIHSKAGFDLS